jgi:hypothetical protein
MLATALTTMTALEVVLFGKNNVALFVVVKVPRFQIAPHVANLPRMKPMPDFTTERVMWSAAEEAGVELWVRRLDAVDSPAPGNKAWKLMYHVERAMRQPKPALLTFGGAWSNHLHATAALGASIGLRTIGVVRAEAEEIVNPTPTLQDCIDFGMELFPVSRSEYKEKDAPFFKAWLRNRFGNRWASWDASTSSNKPTWIARGTPWWSPPAPGPRPRVSSWGSREPLPCMSPTH